MVILAPDDQITYFLLKISHKWPWGVFDTLWNFICQASITYSLSIPTSEHRRTISNQLFFKLKIQMLWQSSWNGLSKQWFWYHFLFQLTLCYDKHQIHIQNGEESIYVSQQQSIMSQRQEPGGRMKIENMEQCSLTVCTHGLLQKHFCTIWDQISRVDTPHNGMVPSKTITNK